MICPVCSFNNSNEQSRCTSCGMLLLNHPLVSVADVEHYKALLAEKTAQNESDFEVSGGVLTLYKGERARVVIPPTVEVIGDHSFTKTPHVAVQEVTIPAGVITVNSRSTHTSTNPANNGAFEMCKSLRRVVFAEGSRLEEIGHFAFWSCENLESIEGLPEHEVFIGRHAFKGCPESIIREVGRHKNYVFEDGWNE